MTLYNVHIYREMRLFFPGIEAATPEEAARVAGDKPTDDAEYTEDCEGETLAAMIDVVGDDEYEKTVTIDFGPERLRKAAPGLLEALLDCVTYLECNHDHNDSAMQRADKARVAIAEAMQRCL